ncbi:tetratricopeptide repeat protein [Alteromonas halophila]|uniref:PEGA domain-containing protein n=1 Tax=Alteromonas halophila TaxID=516698 RepID=A0A918MX66_9ALTE|nr:tetratricopeptide repeat protein [Alteromonas halophila]GGW81487.1 hypothetical protein GCM10007391_13340 [Alteromonas halophila]
MAGVDSEIAASRARKKTAIKSTALGVLGVLMLGAVGAVTYQMFPTGKAAAPVSQPDTAATDSAADARIDRRALQQALDKVRQALTGALTEHVVNWAPDRSRQLRQSLEQAYQDYGTGEYSKAKLALEEIRQVLDTLRGDFQQAYQAPYENATAAFDDNDIHRARQQNRQALKVKPDYEDALALKARLDAFEDVQALYEQARVGKVENNLQKQRDAYARIVAMDPARNDAREALARIDKTLNARRFGQLIKKAVAAVDAQELAVAQRLVDEARSIRPDSADINALQSRIDKALDTQGVTAATEQIQMFARLDEWETVTMLAEKAIASYPDSPAIRNALDTATAISKAHARLDAYIDKPARLADNTIREHAYNTVAEVSSLRQVSAKLGAKIDTVEQLIERENTPLDVTVTSDGESYLKVLGVGHIGKTTEKVIQLKPGRYKLEASRNGYRTVIRDLIVQKSAMPIDVHLVCTEKI